VERHPPKCHKYSIQKKKKCSHFEKEQEKNFFDDQEIRAILLKVLPDVGFCWPKSYRMLPIPIQYSIEEIFICMSNHYNIPNELNIQIICIMLLILVASCC